MSSLEAVFSESAAGTLAYTMAASGKDHTLASAIGVICTVILTLYTIFYLKITSLNKED